jgi:hypothetical protein
MLSTDEGAGQHDAQSEYVPHCAITIITSFSLVVVSIVEAVQL